MGAIIALIVGSGGVAGLAKLAWKGHLRIAGHYEQKGEERGRHAEREAARDGRLDRIEGKVDRIEDIVVTGFKAGSERMGRIERDIATLNGHTGLTSSNRPNGGSSS